MPCPRRRPRTCKEGPNPIPQNKENHQIPCPNRPQHAVDRSTQQKRTHEHPLPQHHQDPEYPTPTSSPAWIPSKPLNPLPPFHDQTTSQSDSPREAQDNPVPPRHGIPILHPLGPASTQSTPPRLRPHARTGVDNVDDDGGSQTFWTLKSCPSQAGTRVKDISEDSPPLLRPSRASAPLPYRTYVGAAGPCFYVDVDVQWEGSSLVPTCLLLHHRTRAVADGFCPFATMRTLRACVRPGKQEKKGFTGFHGVAVMLHTRPGVLALLWGWDAGG